MRKHIKCVKCGGVMIAQTFIDVRGDRYVDGLECFDCWERIITSIMTIKEYKEVLKDYNSNRAN